MAQPDYSCPELAQLVSGLSAAGCVLSVSMPAGRLVHGDEGGDDKPAMWVSDDPAPAGLWPLLRAEHPRSGLWPLLLDTLSSDPRRPWDDGELWPSSMSHPTDHVDQDVLRRLPGQLTYANLHQPIVLPFLPGLRRSQLHSRASGRR